MNLFAEGGPWLTILFFSVLFLVIFRRPLGWLLKLLARSALGLGFLALCPRAAWPPVWPWGSMPSTPSPWACWGCQGWGCSFFSGGWVHNARRPRPSPPSRQISPEKGDPPCATAPITPLPPVPDRPGSAGSPVFRRGALRRFSPAVRPGVLSPAAISQQVSAWLHPPAASTPASAPAEDLSLPGGKRPLPGGFPFPGPAGRCPDPGRRL